MRRKADHLVPLEVSILEAAMALHRQGTAQFHGYRLAQVLKTDADRRTLTAYGTLYRALHRLERAGVIESFWEDAADAEAANRPRRKLYRTTPLAQAVLAREYAQRKEHRKLRMLKEQWGTL
ncbi:MAG TPA: helix-turn-helix transcriptional regulator [Longimicrobiales bacterium]|nr:helix-turn-helix transcriptional regulator [Longimicrobiales bacterium]